MKKNPDKDIVRPVVELKKPLEEAFKKDETTEALAKAIKTLLSRDKKN